MLYVTQGFLTMYASLAILNSNDYIVYYLCIYVLYYWFNVVLSSWSLEIAISMIQLLYLLATWPAESVINNEYERYSINAYSFPGSDMNNVRREEKHDQWIWKKWSRVLICIIMGSSKWIYYFI